MSEDQEVYCEIVSPVNDGEDTKIWLPKQDLNKHSTSLSANMKGGNLTEIPLLNIELQATNYC